MAFVEFEKAFHRVDRKLLLYKLRRDGFGDKMCDVIETLYTNCKASVNVNGYLTDLFQSEYGVLQGDTLSPTLFGLYINDLAIQLNQCNNGVMTGDRKVNCLLYADDLALIADSEENLQKLLEVLHNWCKQWRMRININKTKIVHFRVKSQDRTMFEFTYLGGAI